jgi:hypothetical protein
MSVSAKRTALKILKIVAGIAAVGFWLTPFGTWTQVLLCAGSMVVMFACLVAGSYLDDTGDWPDEPNR